MMKRDVLITLAAIISMAAGFVLFILGVKDIALVFTLVGIFIYLYLQRKKKKEESA
jgi:Ca2+/Na+ antiporter